MSTSQGEKNVFFSDSVVTEILGHGQTDRRTDRPQAFLYYKYTPWSIPD